jgi:hypothetical protein
LVSFFFPFLPPFLQLASLFSPKNFSCLFLSLSQPKKSPPFCWFLLLLFISKR